MQATQQIELTNTREFKHTLAAMLMVCASLLSGGASASPALATQANQASGAGTSPQVCPPDGFVKPERRQIKNAEFQYCTALDDNILKRRECTNWASAKEYVKFKTGRADATYSGMALHREEIILYYCLPHKR